MNRFMIAVTMTMTMLSAANAFAQQRTVKYEVKAGDTCASIAADAYGDPARYDLVHQANELGDPPHILEAGQILQLPKVSEALLRQGRGAVMFKSPESDWSKAAAGLELYRAWRLNTLEQARALVEFRDRTELALRENTLVVIYGASAARAEQRQTHARLESGALRTRLGQLAGGPVTVETESAASDLGNGEALVTVDDDQTTRVANHGGDPITVRGKAGGTVAVNEGFGSKVNRGQKPRPPRPLPPSPTWTVGSTTFPTFDEATVRATWETVKEAREYFVELTADQRGIRVIQSVFVPADVTKLEVQGLPPGDYYATVSAIDDDRFESIPSQRLELNVVSFGFERKLRLENRQFLAGARIDMPDGLRCSLAGAQPAEQLVLRPTKLAPGSTNRFDGYREEMELGCVDAAGNETALTVEAIVPAFEVEGPTLQDGALVVPAGRAVSLDVVFDGPVPPITATAEGLQTSFLAVGPNRGRVRLVDANAASGSRLSLEVADRQLLSLDVTVAEKPQLAAIEPVHYEVGAALLLQTAGSTLVDPASTGGGLVTTRIIGRLLPSDHLSVGLMVDLGTTFSGSNQFVAGVGAETVGSIPIGRLRPFAGVGAEAWFGVDAGATATLEGSLGVDYELFYAQGLRIAGRVAVVNEDVDWLLGLGGFAGYYWSF